MGSDYGTLQAVYSGWQPHQAIHVLPSLWLVENLTPNPVSFLGRATLGYVISGLGSSSI